MNNFIFVASILATFFGAYTVYREVTKIKQRFILLVCSILMAWGLFLFAEQNAELIRIQSIEQQAYVLQKKHDQNFTSRGFIMATLAFLEKNRADFADTYEMAQDACDRHKCLDPKSRFDLTDLAFSFAGLLRGISKINGGK